jgi:tetratricopeptide (TPR) repeat protein
MANTTMVALLAAAITLAGCAVAARNGENSVAPRVEALSLLGEPLFAPNPPRAARERLERELAVARADFEASPHDADAVIWLARRLGYLAHYREAIEVLTDGIARHPDDARLYRHRGHRYITTRQLDRAIADLETAARLVEGRPDEIEPDGAPNAYGIPVSTLHSNIWYHLALAHYLRHDFESALPAWREAVARSTTDDMLVAGSDWLYMTLRRLGRTDEAAEVLDGITAGMRILENDAYHRRLLMYKGLLSPETLMSVESDDPVQLATYGYGVANWHLYNGDATLARDLFRRIVEGPNWAAFGYIAAEAELAARP